MQTNDVDDKLLNLVGERFPDSKFSWGKLEFEEGTMWNPKRFLIRDGIPTRVNLPDPIESLSDLEMSVGSAAAEGELVELIVSELSRQ